ncbi:MAG: hypothetical protein WBP68_01695 [Candidatus Binatus sp.]
MLDAPGFALIGSTLALENALAIDGVGVLDAAGLDDETGCGTASADRASPAQTETRQIAHSIHAVARARRLDSRFI